MEYIMKYLLLTLLLVVFAVPVYGTQLHQNPWPSGPCMSKYDGISRAACPYKDSTIEEWDNMCMNRMVTRLNNGRITGKGYNLKKLTNNAKGFCRCIVRRLQFEYTEKDFYENIFNKIDVNGVNSNEAAYKLLDVTDICIDKYEIYDGYEKPLTVKKRQENAMRKK